MSDKPNHNWYTLNVGWCHRGPRIVKGCSNCLSIYVRIECEIPPGANQYVEQIVEDPGQVCNPAHVDSAR